MDIAQQVQAIDPRTLVPLIRQALDCADAELVRWEARPIPSLLGAAALSTVCRLTGTARAGGETRPWSLILKVLSRSAAMTGG